MNRPLVVVALSFVAGTYLAATGLCAGAVLPLALFAAGLLLTLSRWNPTYTRPLNIVLCFVAVGSLLWNARHAGPPGDPLSRSLVGVSPAKGVVEGLVRSADLFSPDQPSTQFLLDVDFMSIDEKPVRVEGGAVVRWMKPDQPLFAGDRVRVTGELNLKISQVNPRIEGPEDFFRRMGIHSAMRAEGPRSVERIAAGPWWSPLYQTSRLRQSLMERLAQATPPSVFPFVLSVWLGERSRVSPDEWQSYVDSGTVHILSVSGVHAGIVLVVLSFVLPIFMQNPRKRAALILAVMLLFTLLAGARVTTLRAMLMIAVYVSADFFDRERDTSTALSISGLLLLLWNPDWLFDTGFELSFLSVASILLFTDRITTYLGGLPKGVRELVGTSVAVQIIPMPLAARSFFVLPIAAPFANLLVIPLLSVVLWLSLLVSIMVWISRDAAILFGYALEPVVVLLQWIVRIVSISSLSHPALVSPTPFAMAAYWGAAALFAAARPSWMRKPRYIAAFGILLAAAVLCWKPLGRTPEVVFLDVGHGDAAFARFPGGATILVDTADSSAFDSRAARVIAPYLWSGGVTRLDYLVISHPDRDHIGGATYLLNRFRIGQVILSNVKTDRPAEKELMAVCEKEGVPVRRVSGGDKLPLTGGAIEVLHPPRDWPESKDVNNGSLVLRMSWMGMRILFPGDIEWPAEATVSGLDCHADVLKAPHHGSATSSSDRFIDAVAPRIAVVSTGGEYGREAMDPDILNRYVQRGIAIYRTDQLGGIRVVSEDGTIRVEAARLLRSYVCSRQ